MPIGEWVLREACSRMKDWLDAGHDIETIAVNISPRQFDRADICDRISWSWPKPVSPPSVSKSRSPKAP